MPNRVALLRAEIEAAHPGARMLHRSEAGFKMLSADGRWEYLRGTTGPWHWRPDGEELWREIDTDLDPCAIPGFASQVRSARFDTLLSTTGARRFIPRRWLPGEFVEFGRLEYQRANGSWSNVNNGTMRRVANALVGTDATTHQLTVGFHGRGSRTHLTLKTADLARPVRWSVSLVGLTWQDGTLISASDGEQVGFIRPPSWTDASEGSMPKPIPWMYADGYITLTPDFTGAVYPIDVDPDYSIAAGGDDGYVYNTYSFFNSNQISAYIGDNGGATYKVHAWFRFAAIAATQGQECTAATLTVSSGSTYTAAIATKLYGVDEADHAAPTDKASWSTDHGIHTSAAVDWDIAGAWAAGTVATSPDCSSIFDELFAIGAWSTGNDVGIHWDDDGSGNNAYRLFCTYEHTTYTEPILSLTLAAGGSPQDVTLSAAVAPVTIVAPTVQPAVTLTAAVVPVTVVAPTVVRVQIVSLPATLTPVTIVAPEVQPKVSLAAITPVAVIAPTVEQNIALVTLTPVSIPNPEVGQTAEAALLVPVSILPPSVEQNIASGTLTPVSVLAPEVQPAAAPTAALRPVSVLSPTVEQNVTLAALAPAAVVAPTVKTDQTITLTTLAPVSVAAPEAQPVQSATLAALNPVSVLAPTIEQSVTLPTLSPASVLSPDVQTAAALAALTPVTVLAPEVQPTITLPALTPVTVLAPTVDHNASLATVSPITIYAPTVEQLVALATLQPLTLLAPALQDIRQVGLSVLAPIRIIAPAYVRRQFRTEEGALTAGRREGAATASRHEGALTVTGHSGSLLVSRHEGAVTVDTEEGRGT